MIYRYDGAAPSITLQDFDGIAANATTVTVTGLSAPTPSSRRKLIACIQINCTNVPSSVTIFGVAATRVVGALVSVAGRAEIWIADVPTGTSGSVAVTAASTINNLSVALFATDGILSSTATDTASDSVNPVSLPIDIAGRGVVVAMAQNNTSGALGDATWTNATEVVEFTNPGISTFRMSAATYAATAPETARAISESGLSANVCGCAASFR